MFSDIINVSSTNTENFENIDYMAGLDKKLKGEYSGIIVRKDNKIIYSSENYSKLVTIESLPSFSNDDNENRINTSFINQIFVWQYDFVFRDNSQGSIFLLRDVSKIEDKTKELVIAGVIALLSILIFTNGVLTYVVSRSIVNPLEKLKIAANEIRKGNLNFKLETKSSDEIGELYQAFEDMRLRLKESVALQLSYENNRKELISNISHDLKTPVAAIKGYVEGILDGVADTPEKLEKYINTISVKTEDMDRLIEELFLFSKLDLKKVPFNFEKIDINNYFRDCIEELSFDLEKKGITLNYNLNYHSGLPVLVDREKLKRVLMNIIENSVKYMDKDNGVIDISLSENENFAVVEIRDNGKGISKESLPYIFDRFYRGDVARNTSTGGSGLGLSIAKQIIEEHGGSIEIDSEEKIGSKVFFTLKKVKI